MFKNTRMNFKKFILSITIGCALFFGMPVFGQTIESDPNYLDELLIQTRKSAAENNIDLLIQQVDELKQITAQTKEQVQLDITAQEQAVFSTNNLTAVERFSAFKQQVEAKITEAEGLITALEDYINAQTAPAPLSLRTFSDEPVDAAAEDGTSAPVDPAALILELEKLLTPESGQQPLGTDLPLQTITPEEQLEVTTFSGESVSEIPTPEDLFETAETNYTDQLKEISDYCYGNPLSMYNYVKNYIYFEPYYGSRKGASGVYVENGANDVDQASLLIGLLRYNGIPARYATGIIEAPISIIKNWAGTDNAEAAVQYLSGVGIPVTSIVAEGKIVAARFEHTWVKAYLPFEYMRGLSVDENSKMWVDLAPAFKTYEYFEGENILAAGGVDANRTYDEMYSNLQIATQLDGSVVNLNTDSFYAEMDAAQTAITDFIADNGYTDKKMEDFYGKKKISYSYESMIPSSLPFTLLSQPIVSAAVPEKLNHYIGFRMANGLSYETKAPNLYQKQITLSYAPATDSDRQIIEDFGGLFYTPAYLLNVVPQVKVEGRVVAEGSAIGFGQREQFTMTFQQSGRNEERVDNQVTAGSYYAIGLDYQNITPEEISAITQKMRQNNYSVTDDEYYFNDDYIGTLLNSIAKTYFGVLDGLRPMIAEINNVHVTRQISALMTGYQIGIQYMFSMPHKITDGGFYIDVDRDIFAVSSKSGDRRNEIAYMFNAGVFSSAMEHAVFQLIFDMSAVSTIRALYEANAAGIPIYLITKKNLAEVLPNLNLSSAVESEIVNAVNAGKIVKVPQSNIRLNDWYGTGYLILDPSSGAAAYMISGGYAGGYADEKVAIALAIQSTILAIEALEAAGLAYLIFSGGTCGWGAVAAGALLTGTIAGMGYEAYTLYDNLIAYNNGDVDAADRMLMDAGLNIAMLGAFKALRGVIPTCFTEDTFIYTTEGYVLIKDIQAGDLVFSRDPVSGETVTRQVEQVFTRHTRDLVYIYTEGEEIKTTPEHPFYVKDEGYTKADNLESGDVILTADGSGVIIEKTEDVKAETPVRVYNFSVEDTHNYFVTEKGLLVHNAAYDDVADKLATMTKKGIATPVERAKVYTQKVLNKSKLALQHLPSAKPSEILRAELKHAGVKPPPYDNAAHHIIPAGATDDAAVAAQKILEKHGIDINSAANGVFLPRKVNEYVTTEAMHSGGHLPEYYKKVNDILQQVDKAGGSQQDIIKAIDSIREGLLTGQIKIHN